MRMPRVIKGYCPFCGHHSELEIERVKTKPRSEFRRGQRRFRRVSAGYGGSTRAIYKDREKPTKRVYVRYRCRECKKAHHRKGFRAKKFELVEA
ncbi:MAG: 50S ribosomal protein L44e [Thermoplasmata archaeon]|nr:50S ribosomal protein L44e [Thermoplasmata archaeon]